MSTIPTAEQFIRGHRDQAYWAANERARLLTEHGEAAAPAWVRLVQQLKRQGYDQRPNHLRREVPPSRQTVAAECDAQPAVARPRSGGGVSIYPNEVALVQAAAADNTSAWQSFKAQLDMYLNIDYVQNPGGIYEASELEQVINYALGYQALKSIDPTTAANYANRAIGFMANAVGASWCPRPAYQALYDVGQQFLALGDGSTTTFPLSTIGITNPIVGSMSVVTIPADTLTLTRSASSNIDSQPEILESYICKVFQGATVYVQGVDWDRPGDQYPDAILWLSGGNAPAANSTYSVMRAYFDEAAPASWSYNGSTNSIVLASAPSATTAVCMSTLWGLTESGAPAYYQLSFGDGGIANNGYPGGFNSIFVDGPGFTARFLGKDIGIGLDWLDGFGLDATLRANAIALLALWVNWFLANGYNSQSGASNYGLGGYVGGCLAAIALANPAGTPRSSEGATLISTMLSWRENNLLPVLTNSSSSDLGGKWAEGWSYGDGAVIGMMMGSYALEEAGYLSQATAERQWAGEALRSLATNAPTKATLEDYGDWYAYPAPFVSVGVITLLTMMAEPVDATGAGLGAYILENFTTSYSSGAYVTMLFGSGSLPTPVNVDTLPLYRLDAGTGHYCFRDDWSFDSPWIIGQCGNLLNCDHQTYSQGQVEIRRGPDVLLCDGNSVGGNQDIHSKSQFSNTLVINSSAQNYAYNQGFWYGSPGATLTGLDTDNASYASVVGSFAAAYAPASPGNGTGGPCTTLTRQTMYVGNKFLVIYDRVTLTSSADLAQVRWHSTGTWTTPAVVSGGYSFETSVGSSVLFGTTLAGFALTPATYSPTVGEATINGVTFNNASPATSLSYLTLFQIDASGATSALGGRFVAEDSVSEGGVVGANVVLFSRNPSGVTYSSGSSGEATHYVFGMTPSTNYNVNGQSVTANSYGTLQFTNAADTVVITEGTTPAGQTMAPAAIDSVQAVGAAALSETRTISPAGIGGNRALGATAVIGPYISGPILEITDNQNGTGATAVLSGGSAQAINTIQTQLPAQTVGNPVWQQRVTIIGNGTAALPLPTGYYWGSCLSDIDGSQLASNIVWFPVTSDSESVAYRVLLAVQAQIQTLDLPGLAPSQVYVRMTPDPKIVTYPAIFITPEDRETYLAGTNFRDDVGYPALIWIANRNDKDYAAKLPMYELWRERIQRYFRRQPLRGVPEIYDCKVETREIVKFLPPQYQYLVSTFVLRFTSREVRGV